MSERTWPTREEVARVIDPGAFEANIQKRAAPHWREHAYRKADAILAMFSRPASPIVEEK